MAQEFSWLSKGLVEETLSSIGAQTEVPSGQRLTVTTLMDMDLSMQVKTLSGVVGVRTFQVLLQLFPNQLTAVKPGREKSSATHPTMAT